MIFKTPDNKTITVRKMKTTIPRIMHETPNK